MFFLLLLEERSFARPKKKNSPKNIPVKTIYDDPRNDKQHNFSYFVHFIRIQPLCVMEMICTRKKIIINERLLQIYP